MTKNDASGQIGQETVFSSPPQSIPILMQATNTSNEPHPAKRRLSRIVRYVCMSSMLPSIYRQGPIYHLIGRPASDINLLSSCMLTPVCDEDIDADSPHGRQDRAMGNSAPLRAKSTS